ncbi:MAG: proprotein convertase P-domain-containing protein [Saprospiraceae bacterium]|nr:proprotein convertase P-domain-containing protein [Saprospiraceae bacterium]
MKILNTIPNCLKGVSLLPLFLLASVVASFGQTFTFNSAVANQAIPDDGYNGTYASMATKTVDVTGLPANLNVTNVRIIINGIVHTWIGDLTMKTQLPNGQTFGLLSRVGLAEAADDGTGCCGTSFNFNTVNLTFDDAAAIDAETAPTADLTGNHSRRPNKGSIVSPYTTFASLATALGPANNANGTWTIGIGDCAGGDVGSYNSVTVEITAAAPPEPCGIVCPSDMTINLPPGECGAYVNYDVHSTGVCEIVGTINGFQSSFAPSAINYYQNNAGAFTNPPTPFTNAQATTFNSPTNTTFTLVSTDVGTGSGAPSLWFYNGVEWTVNAPTTISFNWTYTTNDGAFWDRFVALVGSATNNFANNNLNTQIGNWTAIHNINGATNQSGTFSVTLNPGQRLALAAFTVDGAFGPCTINISNFTAVSVVPAEPELVQGLPSGAFFPIGTTKNVWTVDLAGNDDPMCMFSVTVLEYPNPISSLVCNDLVQISLDANCEAVVGADQILEGGPYGCYDDYIVELDKTAPFGNGPWVPAVLGPADVGKTYQIRVVDPENNNNKCWGNIKIEDKLPPVLVCEPKTIPCNASTDPSAPPTVATVSGDADFAIADATTTLVNINVPVGATITDVNVVFQTNHTWVGDIDARLTSPAGTEVILFDRPGSPVPGGFGCANDGIDAIFDDEATLTAAQFETTCNAAPPTIAGTYQPVNPLSAFDGQNSAGTWVLRVQDFVGGDGGPVSFAQINISGILEGPGFPNDLVYQVDVFPTGTAGTYIVSQGAGTPVMEPCSDATLSFIDSEVAQSIQVPQVVAREVLQRTAHLVHGDHLAGLRVDNLDHRADRGDARAVVFDDHVRKIGRGAARERIGAHRDLGRARHRRTGIVQHFDDLVVA